MKKFVLLPFLLIMNFFTANSQSIDSSSVQYNSSSQELVCYVGGQLPWFDIDFIVDINYYSSSDTIFIDLHFLPCQMWNTFMAYDTVFNKLLPLNPGNLVVKFTTIHNPDLDTNSCRYNPDSIVVDYAFHNLTILNVDEQHLSSISISPNPVHSILHLDIPTQEKIVVIKISDAFGREIKTPELENGQLDVSYLTNGLYFISIITSQSLSTTRFLKVNN